jgi:hypothetical protein
MLGEKLLREFQQSVNGSNIKCSTFHFKHKEVMRATNKRRDEMTYIFLDVADLWSRDEIVRAGQLEKRDEEFLR